MFLFFVLLFSFSFSFLLHLSRRRWLQRNNRQVENQSRVVGQAAADKDEEKDELGLSGGGEVLAPELQGRREASGKTTCLDVLSGDGKKVLDPGDERLEPDNGQVGGRMAVGGWDQRQGCRLRIKYKWAKVWAK